MDEDDLTGATPEELAAIKAGDGDDSDLETIVGETDGAAEKTAEKTADANTDPLDLNSDGKAPYIAPPVEGYDDKLKSLEERKDDAFKKLMEGELSDSEYRVIEKEVSAEIRKLDRDQLKAEVSTEMTEQQQKSAWSEYVESQINENKAAGADMTDPKLLSELDRTVRLIAAQVNADPSMVAHLPKPKPNALVSPVDKWILNEAIDFVKTRHNLLAKGPINKAKGGAPDLSGIPPTIGRVPAAADPNVGGDEFSYLNKLNGIELERAIGKLSPEQYARYMDA